MNHPRLTEWQRGFILALMSHVPPEKFSEICRLLIETNQLSEENLEDIKWLKDRHLEVYYPH